MVNMLLMLHTNSLDRLELRLMSMNDVQRMNVEIFANACLSSRVQCYCYCCRLHSHGQLWHGWTVEARTMPKKWPSFDSSPFSGTNDDDVTMLTKTMKIVRMSLCRLAGASTLL